jgi:hypothetical protein
MRRSVHKTVDSNERYMSLKKLLFYRLEGYEGEIHGKKQNVREKEA